MTPIEWGKSYTGEWNVRVHEGRVSRDDRAIRELVYAYDNRRDLRLNYDLKDSSSLVLVAEGDEVKLRVDRATSSPAFGAFTIAASGIEGRDSEFLEAMAEFPHGLNFRRELRGYYYKRCAEEAADRNEGELSEQNRTIAQHLSSGQAFSTERFLRGLLFEKHPADIRR